MAVFQSLPKSANGGLEFVAEDWLHEEELGHFFTVCDPIGNLFEISYRSGATLLICLAELGVIFNELL